MTRPSPHTITTSKPTNAAIDNPVSAVQMIRACRSVGGGKFIRRGGWRMEDGGWKTAVRAHAQPSSILYSPSSFSLLSKFLRLLGRCPDGAHHRPAHFAFLQFVQPFDRRAAGAGNHI